MPVSLILIGVQNPGSNRHFHILQPGAHETSMNLFEDDLRDRETAKISCGKAHFESLAVGENPAKFVKATNLNDLLDQT